MSNLFNTPVGERVYSPGRSMMYVNRMIDGRVCGVLYDTIGMWMEHISDDEIRTQSPGVALANGKVLIGGLGLGWFLEGCLCKSEVTSAVVVEISEDLLNWFGYELCESLGTQYAKPVDVICDDVFNQLGKHGEDTWHLLDIHRHYGVPCPRLAEARKTRQAPLGMGSGG